jgi:hypothetical protein
MVCLLEFAVEIALFSKFEAFSLEPNGSMAGCLSDWRILSIGNGGIEAKRRLRNGRKDVLQAS